MRTNLHLVPPAQTQSAQIWRCDACGGQDHKSCSCNSSAHMEEVLTKKEAHRQAAKRNREKAQQNQGSRDSHADIENIQEFSPIRKEAFPTRVMVDAGNGRMRPATPAEDAETFAVANSILNPVIHAWESATREQRLTFARQYFDDVRRILED